MNKNTTSTFTVSGIILFMLLGGSTFSQTTYKEAEKSLRKEKAAKSAKKEAKRWEKEGYRNLPGSLPLANQFQKTFVMQMMMDGDGGKRFLSASGSAISGSEGVAQANAMDNTRLSLAGQVQSEVTSLITNNKANTGYSAEDISTVDEFLASSKTVIQGKIGNIKPVVEMMRMVGSNFEYRFTVLYDVNKAKEVAKEAVQEKLGDKLGGNEAELDKLMGL